MRGKNPGEVALLVEVSSPGNSPMGVGVADELCPWGFVLREFRPLPIGGWVRVALPSGPASLEPLRALGRVAWQTDRCAAIELLPEDSEERAQIEGWIGAFVDEVEAASGRYAPFSTRVTRVARAA